jgi:hypothetical protein
MGILTDRLNSVQRRTTWRMSHEVAIINNLVLASEKYTLPLLASTTASINIQNPTSTLIFYENKHEQRFAFSNGSMS